MHFWLHACGDISLFLEDFIAMGLDVIHPIQKYAMDMEATARGFGGRIAFWAGMDVQQILPRGSAEDVRAETRCLIDAFDRPEGGCIITAGNGITDETGDIIQLEGQEATAIITAIDYTTNTLTLDQPLTWIAGQGVSLAYLGTAPDLGAYEYDSSNVTYGDVSGDSEISAYDAALTARLAVGLDELTPEKLRLADVNGDAEVSAYDAALIAQYAVGLISKFPVEG
jgi:hypothetical protein